MNKSTFTAFVAGTALAALTVGCTETANTNTNANRANSNSAVVVNNNGNANTAGVSTTNANTTANTNARGNYNGRITEAEYEREKDRYAKEAREAGDKIGATATDGWLWVKAKAALTAVDDLRDSTINVDVENGVITLRGNVASDDQVKKADAAVKAVEGKKSVQNQLKVAAGGSGNANGNANRRG